MEDFDLYEKIKDSVNMIFSFALRRTNDRYEAEDLSQEIIMNLYNSAPSLRDKNAYYGWMWAVAGNVYKAYLRKRAKNTTLELEDKFYVPMKELPETYIETREEIGLLYRELSMLSGIYRKTMLLYYMEEKSCEEISKSLNVSVDMVKQYLFKSRKKIKEGMNMIRESGKRSIAPGRFNIFFWGRGSNYCAKLFNRKLPGNIMLEAYYNPVTVEELSIELGVSAVYLEDEVEILLENEMLKNVKGNRLQSNIVIFTAQFEQEVYNKLEGVYKDSAEYLYEFLNDREKDIRSVGFKGCNMSKNAIMWQMSILCLISALIEKMEDEFIRELPYLNSDASGFFWGTERRYGDNLFDFGIQGHTDKRGNKIFALDYFLFEKKYATLCKNIIGDCVLKIACGEVNKLNEHEEDKLPGLVQNGYINKSNGELLINMPIYTVKEYERIKEVLTPAIKKIYEQCSAQLEITGDILKNHIPKFLQSQIPVMAYLKQLESFTSNIMRNMYLNKHIEIIKPDNEALSAFIVLRK